MKMIRFVSLITLLLTACAPPPTSTPPRVVTLSDIPSELDFNLNTGCKFKTAKLNIFGQKAQTLSFNYQQCENTPSHKFKLIRKNEVIDSKAGSSFLMVGKQGPDTEKNYMEAMARRADAENCRAIQTPEKFWTLIALPTTSKLNGTFLSESELYETACGHFEGFEGPKGWVFKFEGGIVFGIRLENVKNTIDLSSITYTNKG